MTYEEGEELVIPDGSTRCPLFTLVKWSHTTLIQSAHLGDRKEKGIGAPSWLCWWGQNLYQNCYFKVLQVISFHLLFSSTMEPNKTALDLNSHNLIIRTNHWPLKDAHQKIQHKNACVLSSTNISLISLPHSHPLQSVVINISGLFLLARPKLSNLFTLFPAS